MRFYRSASQISPEGPTHVWDLAEDGTIKEMMVSPSDFGLAEHSLAKVKGGDSACNAETMQMLLDGSLTGPVLDFVLINSAALLFVAGRAPSLLEAVEIARDSIRSGKAQKVFALFRKSTQQESSQS